MPRVVVFQNKFKDDAALIASFVLLAKFGISMSMCSCYVSTPYIFPVILSGTAFGICNVFGRAFSIATSYVAEAAIPFPMESFSVMALIGLVCCLFVSPAKEEDVPEGAPQGLEGRVTMVKSQRTTSREPTAQISVSDDAIDLSNR